MDSAISLPVFQPGLPLYEQLYRHLLGEIRQGRPAPGEKLPSKRQLCALLGVSMGTVDPGYSMHTAGGDLIPRPHPGGAAPHHTQRPGGPAHSCTFS